MALTKEQKAEIIKELIEKFKQTKSAVFTDYHGLKVDQIRELRRNLLQAGNEFKVTKNTLLNIALKKNNLEIDQSILSKPIAIAFGYNDEVEVCKILNDFAKENKNLEILGGIIDQKFVSLEQIRALAVLPSREELQAKLTGICSAPILGLINVLKGNLRGIISVLKQHQENISKT